MKNRNIVKIIVLAIPVALSAFVLSTIIANLSTTPHYIFTLLAKPAELLKLFLSLLFLGASGIPILSITHKNKNLLYLSFAIILTGFALPQLGFNLQLLFLLTLSSALFVISLYLVRKSLQTKIENTINIRRSALFQPQIKQLYFFIALIMGISFAVGHSINLQKNATTLEIPERIIEQAAEPFTPFVEQQIGTQLQSLLGSRLESQLGLTNQKEILEFLKQESMESLTEGSARQQLGFNPENLDLEKIEITEEGNLDISKALPGATQILQEKIEKEVAENQQKIVIILAFLLFVTTNFISRLALIMAPLLSSLFLTLSRKTGLIQLTTKKVEAEYFKL